MINSTEDQPRIVYILKDLPPFECMTIPCMTNQVYEWFPFYQSAIYL